MASRYSKWIHIQPTRIIPPAITDIFIRYQQYQAIDQLAFQYYKDATLGWIIMCANPDLYMEFAVQPGTLLRIPFPLSRVFNSLGVKAEV